MGDQLIDSNLRAHCRLTHIFAGPSLFNVVVKLINVKSTYESHMEPENQFLGSLSDASFVG